MTDLETKVEALIDSATVFDVLEAIQTVIYEKAAHIESNWQDPQAGKGWSKIAQRLNRYIDKVAFGGKVQA